MSIYFCLTETDQVVVEKVEKNFIPIMLLEGIAKGLNGNYYLQQLKCIFLHNFGLFFVEYNIRFDKIPDIFGETLISTLFSVKFA